MFRSTDIARPPVTVAVEPTDTVVAEMNALHIVIFTVQIDNLDATQTFTGRVQRRQDSGMEWADSTLADFSSIPPLGSVVADLDVKGTVELRVVGSMDGAGGNVRVAARRRS